MFNRILGVLLITFWLYLVFSGKVSNFDVFESLPFSFIVGWSAGILMFSNG
jgi:hypothetical protein